MTHSTLKDLHKISLSAVAAVGLALLLAGCSDSGPAEEAGERIDDAVEEAGDRIDDAAREVEDTIDPPGPAERAGRAVDDAAEEVTGD